MNIQQSHGRGSLRSRRHPIGVDPMSTSPQSESCNTSSSAAEGDDANKEGTSSSDHNEPESDLSLDGVEESEINSTHSTTRQAALQEANRLLLSATRLMLQL